VSTAAPAPTDVFDRTEAPPIGPTGRSYPGARRPDRSSWVSSDGLALAAYEWGDPDAPVIFMAHGGFDFAGTFDAFAPLLADAGWRCVTWDARGHGCSEHSVLYSWGADLRDAKAVLDTIDDERVVVLGHSKGGGVMLELAHAAPHRLSHLVNLDGLPSKNNWPDLADHDRTRMLRTELTGWLDHRRRVAEAVRKPGTLEELAARRAKMNPRLDVSWLEYLVPIGGYESDDGWRWRIDPGLRLGGFGPWRPEWAMQRLPGIGVPVLGILGLEMEVMGWGTRPDDVYPNLPPGGVFHALDGVGHFMHIEQPRQIADLVLDFLGPPPAPAPSPSLSEPGLAAVRKTARDEAQFGQGSGGAGAGGRNTVWVRHGKSNLALHLLREGWGRPLVLLHGLGEQSPHEVPSHLSAWAGPVYALDLTGHGDSTVPAGGGYTAEVLMADVDAALAHLGTATIYGRGLGAYVALLVSGGRPDAVRGVILDDGPGLVGGGIRPGSPNVADVVRRGAPSPDPRAMVELSRDPRPPDYATEFVRQANEWSGLEVPIAVCTVVRPEWLEAVAAEPGVVECSVADALARFGEVSPP
jgi:pimeloyl-ACP methyl ester carboxylesterase